MQKALCIRTIWLSLLANLLFAQQLPFIFVPGGPINVQVMFQDHLGRLWVGGGTDLAFFDGSRFYSLHDLGFPTAAATTALAEDRDGAIWIGSGVGVYRFYRGTLTKVMAGEVQSLVASSGIVVASLFPAGGAPRDPFLFRIRRAGPTWRTDEMMELQWPVAFTVDHNGTLLIPYNGGWAETKLQDVIDWRPGSTLPVSRHDSVANLGFIYLRDRFGCLWSRSIFTTYQCPGDPEPTRIPALASAGTWEAPAGTMVLVNSGNLTIGRPGHFTTATAAQGLPDVLRALIASDGTVWLGGAKGIYRWPQPFRFEYWTARDGFGGNWAICRAGNKVFSGNAQEGIQVLSDDRTRWLPLPATRSLGMVYSLLPDLKGGLFAALRLGGVAHVRADGSVSARAGQPSDYFGKLVRTSDGEVWAAGVSISQLKQTSHGLLLEPETLPNGGTTGTFAPDMEVQPNTGKLWACWQGAGVIHKESEGWQSISTKDGLRTNYCNSLAVLPNGDVWTGYGVTPDSALVRLAAAGKVIVKPFGPSNSGENDQVMFLDADSRSWLWRGTKDGVYVADSTDAENNLWTRLDQTDGLPDVDMAVQGFLSDSDGSVWWVSRGHSVVHFSPPADFVHPTFSPNSFVAGFSWNGQAPTPAEAVSSVPAGANITAHLGSLQFDRRNALRLRYRVLPEHSAWQESRSLDLSLGVLGSGDHTIETQARLGTGPWSVTSAHVVKVLRPFWATGPFLMAIALAGMASGLGAYRWRRRWQKVKRRALPDLSALRADAMVPEAHALIGKLLDGRFLPKQLLARGGFATVFDGWDQAQNCRCAIKIFHREIADHGLARRFAQEVAALEAVLHPNVVRIYGHGETPLAVPYLVMEFIEGQTLREAIPPAGFPVREVASLLRQAGQALAAIHAHGICHRDLKPDNLMIRSAAPPDQSLVLIDFSIAIVKSPDKTVHGLSRAAGTIQYMAPEQAVGWADASSDIFSLAKVVVEMITGRRLSEILPDASRDLPARVQELLAQMPLGLSPESISLMGTALEFDPERRPRNALAFAQKIAADLDHQPPIVP